MAVTSGVTGPATLASIDLRTNRVTRRARLPALGSYPVLISDRGGLWVTADPAALGPRLLRIDPLSGAVIRRLAVPAGCSPDGYGQGRLWLTCGLGPGTRFEQLNPATGKIVARSGPLPGRDVLLAAGPGGAWVSTGTAIEKMAASGLCWPGGRPPYPPTARALDRRLCGVRVSGPGAAAFGDARLVPGSGWLWALAGAERVARVDPGTGRITGIAGHQRFDPSYAFGNDMAAAAGQRSLWLLGPAAGNLVVRLSARTLTAAGQVRVGGSCGRGALCTQIYDAAGSVWVPTARWLVRIDPARIP